MRFGDFFDLNKGPEAIVRLAFFPLVITVAGEFVIDLLNRLTAADFLLLLVLLGLASPMVYLVRESRRGPSHRQTTRRGAERTPLLPPNEEDV
jgi:hypothetical protein